MHKTALIAGSTGLTGSYLLEKLLTSDNYSKVVSLVRKPHPLRHPRLEQIVFDFDNPAEEHIKADHIYCSLGTTIKKAGSKAAFRKVDLEYPLSLARIAYRNGASRFSVITSMGSNPRSAFFYNQVKGELEEELKKIPFEGLYIFRPSLLVGNRKEYRMGENAAKWIMKAVDFLLPANLRSIHVSKVAEAKLFAMQHASNGVHIISSGHMQHFDAHKKEPFHSFGRHHR
jgi:uncharacterized protein YbjT (DUF2867 family)